MAAAVGLICCSVLLSSAPATGWARQSRHLERPLDEVPTATDALAQAVQPVALTALPRQAQDVYQRILAGGPFRYEKDGVVFGNRERLLPRRPRGFYREYTVPTPGERDRGARRIVCGGKEVRQPETCFYSGDHYASFRTIDPQR
ncbi:MAG: ribonuclease N [Proteobacteria bacterium]|uniref:ribonuclease domain-containing protein n=1 Tax=Aquabacterium sp. TaxID=1872578 RepID=UPI0035C6D7A6|nr:ribonuclease N [Pseudomonadota bacterium]